MGPVYVVHCERKRVAERVVYVGLRGEVHNRVDFFLLQDVCNQIRRLDVSLDEFEVGSIANGRQVVQGGTIVQLVEDHDLALRVSPDKFYGDPGSDETCSTGDEDRLWLVFVLRSHICKGRDFHPDR
ncbi:hypothetical protein ATCVCanal1_575L [Acanthocystis turfacea Chlorella virus Canal-1]|nr:hypothetical protein ATCVCanal1_575L [Acanthocystis turfacea Chlorella virus Canal-1]